MLYSILCNIMFQSEFKTASRASFIRQSSQYGLLSYKRKHANAHKILCSSASAKLPKTPEDVVLSLAEMQTLNERPDLKFSWARVFSRFVRYFADLLWTGPQWVIIPWVFYTAIGELSYAWREGLYIVPLLGAPLGFFFPHLLAKITYIVGWRFRVLISFNFGIQILNFFMCFVWFWVFFFSVSMVLFCC